MFDKLVPPSQLPAASLPSDASLEGSSISGPAEERQALAAEQSLVVRGPLALKITDRALLPDERLKIVTDAWQFIDAALRLGAARETLKPRMLGIEIEIAEVDSDGEYVANGAKPLLAQMDSRVWQGESGSGTIEFASSPFEVAPGGLQALLNETTDQLTAAARIAGERGHGIVATGIIPNFVIGQPDWPEMTSPKPDDHVRVLHWENLYAQRAKNATSDAPEGAAKKLELKFADGSVFPLDTSGGSAWIVCNALHVTQQTRSHADALNVFNALRDLTPLMYALSANSGSLNGKKLDSQDYRPIMLAGSKDPSFNFETCMGLVSERANTLHEAFSLIFPKQPADVCPMLWVTSGEPPSIRDAFESVRESVFPSIQLRFLPNDPTTILIEYRPMSVQLSAEQNVALSTFLILAVDYLANHPGYPYISREALVSECKDAFRHGFQSVVTMLAGERAGEKASVQESMGEFLPLVIRHGIRAGLISESEAKILDPLAAQVASGKTCAEILNDSIDARGAREGLWQHWI